MINRELLSEKLSGKDPNKKTHGFFVSLSLYKSLRRLKRAARHIKEKAKCRGLENTCRWFCENFPRLEESMANDMRRLLKMRRLCGKGRRVFVYETLCTYFEENEPFSDENELTQLFEVINGFPACQTLENGMSLVTLARCAVCRQICGTFCEALDTEKPPQSGRIEGLFLALDILNSTPDGVALSTNRVEKILGKDPAKLYEKLSESTRNTYRHNLCRLSAKKRIPQTRLAEILVKHCEEREDFAERHIGAFLCDKPSGGKTYLVLLTFLTVLFCVLLCIISPVFLLCISAIYGVSRLLLEKFFVRFVKPFHLPRLEMSEIPDGNGILVVVTTLLTDEEACVKVADNLERMYYSNGGRNVYFGLLCDLPDSDEKITDKDREIIDLANKKILLLRQKYGDVFFLFMRERDYSQSQQMYVAPERKRGAVEALTLLLCGKKDVFCQGSIKPDEKTANNIRFVFTLDSDTNLAFDCLRTMAGIMLHPCNTPVADGKKGVVTKGYGILQPVMTPTLDTSRKTLFTRVMCHGAGIDNYSTGEFDGGMSLFGRSIFCGKGMFDKNCFYQTLCARFGFEKEKILSHDAPEGARLRCASVTEVTLTDSFPREELAYYKRLHRWIRGDVQNIPFLFGRVKNENGEMIDNNIGIFAKFFLWENLHNALLPILTLAAIFSSVFLEGEKAILVVSVSLSVYFLPFVYSMFSILRRALFNNPASLLYSKGIYKGIFYDFAGCIFRLCAIPKSASVSADAVVRSLWRRYVSKKKTLEWTTAAQNDAEKNDGLLGYVSKNLSCAVCGALLFVVTENVFLKAVSLLWFFMPYFCFVTAKPLREKSEGLSERKIQSLEGYTRDMWKFFENVNEDTHHLPTDCISFINGRKVSRMTSPTNIGLYLVSCAVAEKMGIISSKEMEKRLLETLLSVEKLPKSRGLLYNWYDVFSAKEMTPRFVSSVDMGNFLACLFCIVGVLDEYGDELEHGNQIRKTVNNLIDNADIDSLYNKRRKLFYIGYTVRDDGTAAYEKNCYDMLMSEARLLSYVSLALRKTDTAHLRSLARTFVEGKRYIGVASWSGTVFEYFMPEIFVKAKKGTLVYDAVQFCFSESLKSSVKTEYGDVFGISESCYNAINDGGEYMYKAFGTEKCALCVFDEEKVISPYSSFLMLEASPTKTLKNLETLEKIGAVGEYGFYESIDFERAEQQSDYGVVECFMSHHIGMSICSAANLLLDGKVRRWFSSDKRIQSMLELTEDRIPLPVFASKNTRKKKYCLGDVFPTPSVDCHENNESDEIKDEGKTHLVCAKNFAFLACDRRLLCSFVYSAETGRITKRNGTSFPERICIGSADGFDMCENADSFEKYGAGVRYRGVFNGFPYELEVFTPTDLPLKIITVKGAFSQRIFYRVYPDERIGAKKYVGSGTAFFESENGQAKGFVYGIFHDGFEQKNGADYTVEDGVCASVMHDFAESENAQTVFLLGCADSVDMAAELVKKATADIGGLRSRAEAFSKRLKVDFKKMPKEIKLVLTQNFGTLFDTAKGIYTEQDEVTFALLCLLLVYTDACEKSAFIKRLFEKSTEGIPSYLCCTCLAEYVRICEDTDFPDVKTDGESLYRRGLSMLLSRRIDTVVDGERALLRLAVDRYRILCSSLSDGRAEQVLSELSERLS